jgi:putative hemolysin
MISVELSSVLMALCWFLYFLMALLSDALRFASYGFLKAHLQKKHSSTEALDKVMSRMEGYFDDSGRNLRELEWGSHIFFYGGFVAYLSTASSLAAPWESLASTVSALFLVIMIVGSVLVRGFSEPYAEPILICLYPIWKAWHVLMAPLTWLVNGLQVIVQRVGGVEDEEEEEREQKFLDSMEDGSKTGLLDASEREMIENLIEFKDLEVSEVMTPRTDMVAVPKDSSIDDVIKQMVEKSFSRIMVYEDNRDNIIGFVHVRDLLPFWRSDLNVPLLETLLHPAYYVPDSKSIRSLFQEFKSKHLHIAVVLDEYGGTAGLITLEDILEEIVGDIVDEHQDQEEKTYEKISENEVQAQGKMRVSELEELFDCEFEENDSYDSVGGMIISHLGRIPVQGEKGELPEMKLSYKVIDANERRIESVLFTRIVDSVES